MLGSFRFTVKQVLVYASTAFLTICGIVVVSRCDQPASEHFSRDEVIKAVHDDQFLSHAVIDSIINDHDGMDHLAERLAKDPAAAGQLIDNMVRKGLPQGVLAERCSAVSLPDRPLKPAGVTK